MLTLLYALGVALMVLAPIAGISVLWAGLPFAVAVLVEAFGRD